MRKQPQGRCAQRPVRERAFAQGSASCKAKNRFLPQLAQFSRTAAMSMEVVMTELGESSAPHLLSRPGVQRFPSSRLDLFVVRAFLSRGEFDTLVRLIEAHHRPSTSPDGNKQEEH